MSRETGSISQFIQLIGANPSGTTPEVLRSHVERIDEEIHNVKLQIRSTIQSDWPGFESLWMNGVDLLRDSGKQEEGLKQIEATLESPDGGLIPRLLASLKEHKELAARHADLALVLATTTSLSSAFQSLSDLVTLLEAGSLDTAVRKLMYHKSSISQQSLVADSWLAKRAVNGIKELEEDLKQRLIDAVMDGVAIWPSSETDSSCAIDIRHHVDSNKHRQVSTISWSSAMAVLQELSGGGQSQLNKIVTAVVEQIVIPIIVSQKDKVLSLTKQSTAAEDPTIRLLLGPGAEAGYDLYDSLKLLLSTLQEYLFTNDKLLKAFARILVPRLQTCLVTDYLHIALPSTPDDEPHLFQLPKLLLRTREFGSWLCAHGWLVGENTDCLVLGAWCDQVGLHFAKKLTNKILEQARRDILMTQWDGVAVEWHVDLKAEPEAELPSARMSDSQASSVRLEETSPPKSIEGHNFLQRVSSPNIENPPQPPNQSPLLKDTTGLKSLFNFGIGSSQQTNRPSQSAASPNSRSTSPSKKDPTSFRSLFSFGSDAAPPTGSGRTSNPTSSPPTEKTISSPELIERISETSSPKSTDSKAQPNLSISPPSILQAPTTKVDEDIDWDLGIESATIDANLSNNPPSMAAPPSRRLPQPLQASDDHPAEVEEDAWGLSEVDRWDEQNKTPSMSNHSSHTELLQPSSSISTTTNTHLKPLQPKDTTPEDEERPDPDGWGFDEEEPDVESEEVMRLRGGTASPPHSEDEEDGWAWNDDPLVDETAEISQFRGLHDKKMTGQLGNGQIENSASPNPRAPEPSFIVEKMIISRVAQRLVELARSLIKDASTIENPDFSVKCIASSSPYLIQAALDLFDVFRILMPLHHRDLLNSVPSLSAQFANDCQWLSKAVKTIEGLTTEDADRVSQKLKAMAVKTRDEQSSTQRAILMEYLDEAEGFTATSDEQRFLQCERACKQVIHTLEQLSHVWEPVMFSSGYARSMGQLVESVLKRVLEEIQAQSDISETESKQLNILCKSFHQLSNLFGNNPEQSTIAKYVPSWIKFCFLSELLEASMADIMWMHQEGLLLEFSTDEIIGLIRALFSDSTLRAKNIDIITSTKTDKCMDK